MGTRKELRSSSSYCERVLWNELKNKKLLNLKFRRQHGIGNYIVDFYCHAKDLVIEIDGEIHDSAEAKENDKRRTEYLISLGLKVIRFSNEEVIENMERVLEEIKKYCL